MLRRRVKRTSLVVAIFVLVSSLFVGLKVLPEVRATTLYVGGGGSGNYTTIQGAIDAASPGDTVYVYGGTYYENIIIDKMVSLLGEHRDTTIVDGNGTGVVVRVSADWVNITGFTVQNGGQSLELIPYLEGIGLRYASNCSITDNNISSNEIGLSLHSSNDTTITRNVISSNHKDGIFSVSSNNNTIANNDFSSNWRNGITLYDSDNNDLIDNTFLRNAGNGAQIGSSSSNTIYNNIFLENGWEGFYVHMSSNITMVNNSMIQDGLIIGGNSLVHWNSHTVETSNTVNGNPLHYWKDIIGGTIPTGSGGVILANCTDVTVENQTLSNSSVGVELGFSSNITIANNTITDNWDGIKLYMSNYSTITSNIVRSNRFGVDLQDSSSNAIVDNTISNQAKVGVFLSSSDKNTILRNHISNNDKGVILAGFSEDNWVHHNDFVNNTEQASATPAGPEHWDNGYPSGGNYWSDYLGEDKYSGPGQDQLGSDGIGDTPYPVGNAPEEDRYPLMSPFGTLADEPPTCNITVPAAESTLSGNTTIGGTAGDPDGAVEKVEIRIDDRPWTLANGTTSWTYHWDTEEVSNGEHTIRVRCYDGTYYSDELSILVIVDNPHEHGDPLLGQVFFWLMVALVVIIALVGLILEIRRRKTE